MSAARPEVNIMLAHTKSGYFGFSSGFPRRIFPNLEKARNKESRKTKRPTAR